MKRTIIVLLGMIAAAVYFAGCSSDEPITSEYPKFELGADGGGCKEGDACNGNLFCIEGKCQKVAIETTETDETVETVEAPKVEPTQEPPGKLPPDQPEAGEEIVVGECKTNVDCKTAGTYCVKGKCLSPAPYAGRETSPAGECVPDCASKQCGDNGCGGHCGTCNQAFHCSESFQCVINAPPAAQAPVSAAVEFKAKVPIIKGTIYKTLPAAIQSSSEAKLSITFPDKNLEKAVKAALTIADDKPITVADCLKLKKFFVAGLNISDLIGLQYCSNLEDLTLSQTLIRSIKPLETLKKLKVLGISNNPIGSIEPISGLTALEELHLDNIGSATSSYALSELSKLNKLVLSNIKIKNLSAWFSTKADWSTTLTDFDLAHNNISDISYLKDFGSLKSLILDDNKITDIAALVDNTGIGDGDFVSLLENPLSPKALKDIEILEKRGVTVYYYQQSNEANSSAKDKVGSVEIRIKVASSANKGGTDLPVYVSFCKDRKNCLPLDQISIGSLYEGELFSVNFGADWARKLPEGFSKKDLSVIRFCIGTDNKGNDDDQLYIGAVMVLADGEPWYFNPTFFRMLDKGSCTNAIRDEDVFIGLYARTDNDCFYNDGTDEPVELMLKLEPSKITKEQKDDIKADFQDASEMNKKYFTNEEYDKLIFNMESDADDFNCEDKGFYGVSAPLADATNFGSFDICLGCNEVYDGGIGGGDDWDYEPIEFYAGKVTDLLKNYKTACYYRKHDGKLELQDTNTLTTIKGSCLDLKDLGTKDYSGEMGKGDLAPKKWFDELIKYQKGKHIKLNPTDVTGEPVELDAKPSN